MKKIIAVLLAFMLTGALILFGVSFLGRQIILPAMDEDGAQVSDAVIREEQQLAQERVTKLAGLYGFDAEPVISLIGEETIRELNSQASRWWSTLLQDGKTGETLHWDTDELEQVLASDPRLAENNDAEREEYLELSAAEDIRNSILHMVLPMRIQVIRLGMQEIGKRIDLPNIVTFFLGVPWAALSLCVLLAGLIALLQGKKFHDAALYIGSAMGAAALVQVSWQQPWRRAVSCAWPENERAEKRYETDQDRIYLPDEPNRTDAPLCSLFRPAQRQF